MDMHLPGIAPEFGHFALILCLFLAIAQSILPLVGSFNGNRVWMASSRSLATGLFVLVAFAFACLTWSFLHDDFSVVYVAGHSNSLLPDHYKISAVWGGHEGSLLLWVLILCGWALAVACFSRELPLQMVSRVLSVMGMITVGFLSFVLFTSNPFDRHLPNAPQEGSDLNPLLQDPGLIIHPPMLYMGYVGFSVVFAFAIAALISGRLDSAWARWSRPWTTVAWVFLTLGIALGSWWAYYELGWGGWWFWDPVENASFMPWLVGTALVHSLAVTEKRGIYKSWTLLLAIFAFSLSLLGTFLVRSGVLTSVHAFAADPERGVFILGFLGVVVGGSLTLYAFRAPVVKSYASFGWFSREAFLLFNNILLVVSMLTILLGTLYPLIADALDWGKISVGPPYFNFFFVPLMAALSLLLGVGSMLNWKRTDPSIMKRWLSIPLIFSAVLAFVAPIFLGDEYSWGAVITIFLGSWVISAMVADMKYRLRNQGGLLNIGKLSLSYKGMIVAHIGVAFTVMGAGLNTIYSDQRDLRMEPGKVVEQGGYTYFFDGVEKVRGPNYIAEEGRIRIFKGDTFYTELKPQKRRYFSSAQIMTEAAIDGNFFRDLYVALGEKLDDGPGAPDTGAWAVRLHYKPFVRWIWLGSIFMGIGGLMAICDKRYRRRREKAQAEAMAVA